MALRRAGRSQVKWVGLSMLWLSGLIIAFSTFTLGPDRLPLQLVRFGIAAMLAWLMYRGVNWARWMAAVFCLLGSATSFYVLLNEGFAILFLILGVSYLCFAGVLVFAPSVQAFFLGGGSVDSLK